VFDTPVTPILGAMLDHAGGHSPPMGDEKCSTASPVQAPRSPPILPVGPCDCDVHHPCECDEPPPGRERPILPAFDLMRDHKLGRWAPPGTGSSVLDTCVAPSPSPLPAPSAVVLPLVPGADSSDEHRAPTDGTAPRQAAPRAAMAPAMLPVAPPCVLPAVPTPPPPSQPSTNSNASAQPPQLSAADNRREAHDALQGTAATVATVATNTASTTPMPAAPSATASTADGADTDEPSAPVRRLPQFVERSDILGRTRRYFSPSECARHNELTDCWLIAHGKVYEVTSFLSRHPAQGWQGRESRLRLPFVQGAADVGAVLDRLYRYKPRF
jgi:hypothetical protein